MATRTLTQTAVNNLKPNIDTYDVRDSKVTGFLARVRPSGAISYIYQYRDLTGTQRNYTIGVDGNGWNATTAREEAENIRFRARRGEDPHFEKRNAKQHAIKDKANTLRAFFEGEYQLHLETKKRSSQLQTHRIIYSEFAGFLDTPLVEITAHEIRNWRSYRRKHGRSNTENSRPLSEDTLRRYNSEIDVLLEKAVEYGYLEQHPLRGKIKPIKCSSRKNIKPRFFSAEESQFFRDSLKERDQHLLKRSLSGRQWRLERNYTAGKCRANDKFADHLTPMCLLSLNTGMRRGELFKLSWHDIAKDYSFVELRAETTKSGKVRGLPLNDEARTTLETWREQTIDRDSELVFPNSNGEIFQDVKSHWRSLMKRWKQKFDQEPKNFRWHDMRHDFASQLVMRGVPLNTVRELLGHATIEMTLRYAHLADKSLSDAVATLASKNE